MEFVVYYHLRNQNNPHQTLTLTSNAWHHLLFLARESGWNPMGTIHPQLLAGFSIGLEDDHSEAGSGNGTYTPSTSRLVMLEDALNLMDALDRAFLNYEPEKINVYRGIFRTEWDRLREWSRPGIGILQELADFCRSGSFWIEYRSCTQEESLYSI